MAQTKSASVVYRQSIPSSSSRGEFDFKTENAKLRQMTDIQLREHGQECGRQVDAISSETTSGFRHANYRYELAKEEFSRRHEERRERKPNKAPSIE